MEMAMGDETWKWMSLLVQYIPVNQTINRRTECLEYVPQICPEFAPKRFYVSLSVSILILHFFLDKKKTGIKIFANMKR